MIGNIVQHLPYQLKEKVVNYVLSIHTKIKKTIPSLFLMIVKNQGILGNFQEENSNH